MTTVAVDPTSPKYVYAAVEECSANNYCQNYVYRSADGGATWKRAAEVEKGVYFTGIRFDPTSASIAYATTDVVRG